MPLEHVVQRHAFDGHFPDLVGLQLGRALRVERVLRAVAELVVCQLAFLPGDAEGQVRVARPCPPECLGNARVGLDRQAAPAFQIKLIGVRVHLRMESADIHVEARALRTHVRHQHILRVHRERHRLDPLQHRQHAACAVSGVQQPLDQAHGHLAPVAGQGSPAFSSRQSASAAAARSQAAVREDPVNGGRRCAPAASRNP